MPSELPESGAPAPERGGARAYLLAARPWFVAFVACICLDTVFLWETISGPGIRAPGDINGWFAPFLAETRPALPPRNTMAQDWTVDFHPWQHAVRDSWRAGRAPLWDDLSGCGAPLAANMQAEAFSPYLPLSLLTGERYPTWRQFAQLVVAQLGALALARQFRLSALAGLGIAFAFSMSAMVQAWAMHPLGASASFGPALTAAMVALRISPGGRRLAVAALLLAASILAGHIETACISLLGATLVALVYRDETAPARGDRGTFMAFATAVVFFGAMLAAVQLLPFYDYLAQSECEAERSAIAVHPLSLEHLSTFVDPLALGSPVAGTEPYRGDINFNEVMSFSGCVVLGLALTGALLGARSRPWLVAAALTVAAVGLLIVYGPAVIQRVLSSMPPFDETYLWRYHQLTVLPLCVLAGVALERLVGGALANGRRILPTVAVLAIPVLTGMMIAFAGARAGGQQFHIRWLNVALAAAAAVVTCVAALGGGRRSVRVAIALVAIAGIGAEGIAVWDRFIPVVAPAVFHQPSRILEEMARHSENSRCLEAARTLTPCFSELYGVASIRRYDAIGLSRLTRLLASPSKFPWALGSLAIMGCDPRYLDILSARWVLTSYPADDTPIPSEPTWIHSGTPWQLPLDPAGSTAVEMLVYRDVGKDLNERGVTVEVAGAADKAVSLALPLRDGDQPGAVAGVDWNRDVAVSEFLAMHLPERTVSYVRFRPGQFPAGSAIRVSVAAGANPVAVTLLKRMGLGAGVREAMRVGGLTLSERTTALPRAYVAPGIEIRSDLKSAVATVRDPQFDPHATTVVEASGRGLGGRVTGGGAVVPLQVERRSAGELIIPVEVAADALVVVTDAFALGWEATVDGVATDVFAANVVGRAVVVPKGRHVVRMVYRPLAYSAGLLASGLGLIWALWSLVRPGRKAAGAAS